MTSYTYAFRVDFTLNPPSIPHMKMNKLNKTYDSSSVLDCINFRVCALHRADPEWNFDRYEVRAELYHGIMPIAHNQFIFGDLNGRNAFLFGNRVVFDQVIRSLLFFIFQLNIKSRVRSIWGFKNDIQLEIW